MTDVHNQHGKVIADTVAATAEPDQHESFADLLEKTSAFSGRLNPGQRVRAKIISISADTVYLDLGGKSEGTIPLSEFINEEGQYRIKEGDEIDASFVSVRDGLRMLTTLIHGYSSVHLNKINEAFRTGLPLEGLVKGEIKGGFEISISGVKCFCPFSQIDMGKVKDTAECVGRTFQFKVLEYKDEGRTIVVSRRMLLKQEQEDRRNRLRQSLSEGMEVIASIKSVHSFGAFADLGGIDGLIPVSELSWTRIENPVDFLSIGQEVTAKIISLDWDNNRITLSIKATQPDPWTAAAEKYPVETVIRGPVMRLVPFGAFVNAEPGIDGLIHISNMRTGKRINHPREVLEVGQIVEAHVIAVDPENRRLSLSMEPGVTPEKRQPQKIDYPAAGELLTGKVQRVMPFGIFVRLDCGVTGLIPNAEIGTPHGTDHSKMFAPWSEIQIIVTDVDIEHGKVSLSRIEALKKLDMEEFRQYKDTLPQDEAPSHGLGRLGELLRAKMDERKQQD